MINDDAARTTRTKQQVMRKIEARETPRRSVIWKTVCVLSLVISSLAPSSFAQIGGSIPLIKYAQRESRKDIYYESDTYFSDRYYELWSFTDALEFLEEYRGIEAGTILPIRISTWSIPVTLVRLHSDDFGFTRIVPTLSVGIGYVWISGTSIIDAKSESIRIEPQTALGFATSFGAVNGITGIEGSITVSGIIGFRSMFMSLGYDILTDTGVLGVGIRVDVFGLSSNSYEISRLSN